MSLDDHERLYTPSEWSKRYNSEELLAHFFKFCEEVTEETRKTIKCELNVPYGPTERAKYDIYGVDLPKDAPIFIFIHGGYWQEFSKDLTGFAVPLFVKNKIKVITVGYDLCPNVRIGDIVAEIKSAVAQILKYAADSGSKYVCIAGHSAGAHLAACLLHDDDWINRMTKKGYFAILKEIILIGGIYNLKPITNTSFAVALKLTDEEIKKFSISTFDEAKDRRITNLKVIVVVGDCDSPAFIDESRKYAQKLISIVDNVEYLLLQDIDHFDIVEKLLDPNYHLAKLILKCLQPDVILC
ncbi:PREDICTED: kynurenine formamidase [Trachymyrmex septentrionalis]|uniref:kynurenine formamidase n=1 Tax=Trachymyrmex septentrionalis TaxID=34720 RepID=UPI00084F6AE1|nr:PREDICTED: kynurenine formamidase [Trachymyrmex septentrionalis]XP_018355517.1 PREDICTED: kynurenine formamidase [Trachymyrmex septentrionalis]